MRTPRRIHGSACSALILRSRAERGVSKDEGGRCGATCMLGPWFETRGLRPRSSP